MPCSAGGVNSSRVYEIGAALLDSSHVTGLEVQALVNVSVEYPHHRGIPSPCRHGNRSEKLRGNEC